MGKAINLEILTRGQSASPSSPSRCCAMTCPSLHENLSQGTHQMGPSFCIGSPLALATNAWRKPIFVSCGKFVDKGQVGPSSSNCFPLQLFSAFLEFTVAQNATFRCSSSSLGLLPGCYRNPCFALEDSLTVRSERIPPCAQGMVTRRPSAKGPCYQPEHWSQAEPIRRA